MLEPEAPGINPELMNRVQRVGSRKLEDLKAGDRVRLRWIREENRLVAESIAVVRGKAP